MTDDTFIYLFSFYFETQGQFYCPCITGRRFVAGTRGVSSSLIGDAISAVSISGGVFETIAAVYVAAGLSDGLFCLGL